MPLEKKETKKSLIEQLKKKGCKGYSNMNVPELKEYLRLCKMSLTKARNEAKRLHITDVREMKKPELARVIVQVRTLLEDKRLPFPDELINLISGYARSPITAPQEAMNELVQLLGSYYALRALQAAGYRSQVSDPNVYIYARDPNDEKKMVIGDTRQDIVRNA